jgi:hypothetical protein
VLVAADEVIGKLTSDIGWVDARLVYEKAFGKPANGTHSLRNRGSVKWHKAIGRTQWLFQSLGGSRKPALSLPSQKRSLKVLRIEAVTYRFRSILSRPHARSHVFTLESISNNNVAVLGLGLVGVSASLSLGDSYARKAVMPVPILNTANPRQ